MWGRLWADEQRWPAVRAAPPATPWPLYGTAGPRPEPNGFNLDRREGMGGHCPTWAVPVGWLFGSRLAPEGDERAEPTPVRRP